MSRAWCSSCGEPFGVCICQPQRSPSYRVVATQAPPVGVSLTEVVVEGGRGRVTDSFMVPLADLRSVAAVLLAMAAEAEKQGVLPAAK